MPKAPPRRVGRSWARSTSSQGPTNLGPAGARSVVAREDVVWEPLQGFPVARRPEGGEVLACGLRVALRGGGGLVEGAVLTHEGHDLLARDVVEAAVPEDGRDRLDPARSRVPHEVDRRKADPAVPEAGGGLSALFPPASREVDDVVDYLQAHPAIQPV